MNWTSKDQQSPCKKNEWCGHIWILSMVSLPSVIAIVNYLHTLEKAGNCRRKYEFIKAMSTREDWKMSVSWRHV